MTTLKEIIGFLKEKSERELKCQPSMDGSREKYYQGKYDAFQDCVQMLEKYCEQSEWKEEINEEHLDDIAEKMFEQTNYVDYTFEVFCDGFKVGYKAAMKGE